MTKINIKISNFKTSIDWYHKRKMTPKEIYDKLRKRVKDKALLPSYNVGFLRK